MIIKVDKITGGLDVVRAARAIRHASSGLPRTVASEAIRHGNSATFVVDESRLDAHQYAEFVTRIALALPFMSIHHEGN